MVNNLLSYSVALKRTWEFYYILFLRTGMFVIKYLFSQSLMTTGRNYMYSINNLRPNIVRSVKLLNAIHYKFKLQ